MARRQTDRQTLGIDGIEIPVSNLEKLLYPAGGVTKAHVIDYYVRVSKWLLPHLRDRPVTLKRYPDGVKGEHFYEKDAPSFTPEWVRTFPVPRRTGESDIRYIIIDNLATLVWAANLANIEIHPFLHRVPAIETPTSIAFDLDPGEGANIENCAEVAFLLKGIFDDLNLKSFAKVSGSKGIQIYVPLNSPVSYAVTQTFARALAQLLENQYPKLVVSEMAKIARTKKVFIDWSQNSDYKTTVGVYSLRAKRERPFVSAPVSWEELQHAKDLYFSPSEAIDRCEKLGDFWVPVLKLKQQLPDVFVSSVPKAARSRIAPKSLDTYRAKRNFGKTPEPAPEPPLRASGQGGRRRFVIQKHAASHLHYDFRLEMHGVLKSWAVPKGVPYTLEERRLAAATEDHPLEYFDFEGIIPKGQYGGGTVMVWDIGTYEVIEGNYYKGYLHLSLSGKKLKGEWLLVKDKGEAKNWRLTKFGKPIKAVSERKNDTSALTGRSMAQIAAEKDKEWQSNRSPAAVAPAHAKPGPAIDYAALPNAEMQFIEPMQAKLVAELPAGPQWQYEIKLDGYRALAIRTGDRVRLLSRRNNPLNSRFPTIATALEKLDAGTILDGELVALDENGLPSFNTLQNHQTAKTPILYYVFDVLASMGKSLLSVALEHRRDVLTAIAASLPDPIRLSGSLQADPADLIAAGKEQGLEGFIAKSSGSIYEPGRRTGAWVKYKIHKGQELIIGGYRVGTNGFDNLAVGYYEGPKLLFIAKVRNGFTPELRRKVAARFKGLETTVCPFANLPEPKSARRGEALTAEAMKAYRWLKPRLVAEIDFADWTDANHLRHSRFVGFRDDKDPKEVVREVER
jgi:bifunctional non-homologous end joining protein LigD